MMKVEYTGRQTTINKKLKSQAEAGLDRIAKLVGKTASAHVILTEEKYRHIAEITVVTRGYSLVATCKATDMETALHDALAKVEQQAIRHKQKSTTLKRHPKGDQKEAVAEAASADVPVKRAVKKVTAVKAKASKAAKSVSMVVHSFPSKSPVIEPHVVRSIDSAAMRPMSFEEAVKEAAFRDRDVFVFRDHGGQAMVLHRKRDGRMELIEIPQ